MSTHSNHGPRRKFFATHAVQGETAANIELGVQLRRGQQAQEAPPDITGASWATSVMRWEDEYLRQPFPPQSNADWHIHGRYLGGSDHKYLGRMAGQPNPEPQPWPAPWEAQPLEGPHWRCEELWVRREGPDRGDLPDQEPLLPPLFGILIGRHLPQVQWHLAWSHSAIDNPNRAISGEQAHSHGNVIWVNLNYEIRRREIPDVHLTATATSAGREVGQLQLHIQKNLDIGPTIMG